ncbi:cysteinyl-tRNA synthetase [Bifidobacterium animalis subsp. animalis MCC 1489]|uniref:Cysteine--tRNA ligase n=1 Tax=Bifidobacterium animalis subsp. animalis IM386 TaxID=1402194 RepID=A0AAV2W0K9_9BIFI|nr:cysteine--tRNA ligase [Bifidobacterium animalis]AFI62508.1 cysteinyl-tRNA synthetase [Bifidobacterium animalis subsp. animalis ATCC 25527]AYN23143.1 cysteinyl-tRNA synthetase [Bifidobacterium animalis subsp. animalis]KOA62880.1 cysteinyl-tRNA synthetase [Bifidobacterium animalis subsp. animalis MCC 1489]CDI67007.1 Cysteine--tRNA ligase (Cysteinyl-tR NA synthetase) [Bifidobacterium animalis subsp. animalis IM386]
MTHAQSHTTDQFDETLAAGDHGVANAAVDLKLYDTATHAVSRFEPIKPGEVGMYVCGATVQSAPHIGHIRAAVAFDIIRRWFERLGYKVTFIRNVTDIDDKILDKAAAAGEDWWARAYHYEREFTHAYNELGVLAPTYEPRATGHIIDMVHLIERIIDNGHAYVIRDEHGELTGDVYFDVASWPHYGELTHQKQTAEVDEAAAVADRMGPSVDASGDDKYNPADPADLSVNKRDPRDFALWKRPKSTDPTDARWKTPFGTGRPGWHIECSAMSYRYLDGMFDIHGGGLDLRFPHHENEMAQTRAAGYCTANRWMHSAWVTAKGEKMSKSLGNGLSVPVVLAEHSAWVVRYALGSVQYRSMLEWSDQTLAEADAAYERIMNFIGHAADALGEQPSRDEITGVSADDLPMDFVAAMNDDVNVSRATAAIFTQIREGNTLLARLAGDDGDADRSALRAALVNVRAMLDTLGLDPLASPWIDGGDEAGGDSSALKTLGELVDAQLAARAEARKNKDFAKADQIRDALTAAGITIEDGPTGSTWTLALSH